MELSTVSQVARELGISVDWLRKAEKQGRIPQAKRKLCGWRAYTPDDVDNLKRILLYEPTEKQYGAGDEEGQGSPDS